MRGKMILSITEWENPDIPNRKFTAEIYPFVGERVAWAATYETLLKRLASKKVQDQLSKLKEY